MAAAMGFSDRTYFPLSRKALTVFNWMSMGRLHTICGQYIDSVREFEWKFLRNNDCVYLITFDET